MIIKTKQHTKVTNRIATILENLDKIFFGSLRGNLENSEENGHFPCDSGKT